MCCVCCGCSVGAEEAKSSVEIKQVAVKSVDSNIALIRASKEVCVRLWNVRVLQCLCLCLCMCMCMCAVYSGMLLSRCGVCLCDVGVL